MVFYVWPDVGFGSKVKREVVLSYVDLHTFLLTLLSFHFRNSSVAAM
jgi:hypothetical protein